MSLQLKPREDDSSSLTKPLRLSTILSYIWAAPYLETAIRKNAHHLFSPNFIRSAGRVSSVPDTIQHSITVSFTLLSLREHEMYVPDMGLHPPSVMLLPLQPTIQERIICWSQAGAFFPLGNHQVQGSEDSKSMKSGSVNVGILIQLLLGTIERRLEWWKLRS